MGLPTNTARAVGPAFGPDLALRFAMLNVAMAPKCFHGPLSSASKRGIIGATSVDRESRSCSMPIMCSWYET